MAKTKGNIDLKETGFKLLAIRPLEGCNEDFTRVLKHGQIYQFYNNYTFIKNDTDDIHSEVSNVVREPIQNEGLFNIGKLPINVSSIVGKNGSGKSSLIELFFASIFITSVNKGVLKPNLDSMQKDWERLDDKRTKVISRKEKLEQKRESIKNWINESKLPLINEAFKDIDKKFQKLYDEASEIENTEDQIAIEELDIEFFRNEIHRLGFGVKVEIYYKLNTSIYRLTINSDKDGEKEHFTHHELINGTRREENLWKLLNEKQEVDFNHLFYSIAISYSHYALNSKIIGDWVNPLFHKNDGYQTPLVINPMRTEGNIDVNTENELVLQRLLLNILEDIGDLDPKDSLRNLAPDKTAFAIELQYDEEKVTTYSKRKIKSKIAYPSSTFLNDLCFEYVGSNNIFDHGDQVVEGVKLYIENKLIRICKQYDRYKRYIVKGAFSNDRDLITLICQDNSHITFKLKQAINFLILGHYPINDGNQSYKDDLETFSNFIKDGQRKVKEFGKNHSAIELLPPSVFKVNIKLTDETNLEDLSSGEKQLIHSISSIVYHIINLNSVSDNGEVEIKSKNKDVINYNYINILFDEVEQYFHPELQRKFLFKLLDYLKKMNPIHFKNIKGINMLFVTHSPFILSDIPASNILRLEDGEPSSKFINQTFGANIHDLLANDFFLKDSLMGEFANDIIKKLIIEINKSKNLSKGEAQKFHDKIEVIGEIFIKQKLTEMVIEKTSITEVDKIQSIIDFKETEIQNLKNDQKRINKHDKDR